LLIKEDLPFSVQRKFVMNFGICNFGSFVIRFGYHDIVEILKACAISYCANPLNIVADYIIG